ncbi:MAG TPA: sulfurtransferase TusA family protein [Acidimicrobiia bacterium]|jgi:TusA-related sulfurtransferase
MTSALTHDEFLDTSELLCPLPVYQAAQVLNRLASGQVLRLVTTDRGSLQDIPALARQRGDELLAVEDQGPIQLFWIRKNEK